VTKYNYYTFTFTFADGYCVIARGFSKAEKQAKERQHGVLVSKTFYGKV
jgi:hypothetical protein